MASNALQLVGPIPRGGQTTYEQETADEICRRIAQGETLTTICKDPDMPPRSTVCDWLMYDREGFTVQYARSRELQGDFEADEIKEISDAAGVEAGEVQKARLQVETRKWRAERLNRRVYGQKVAHEHEHTLHPTYGEERLPAGVDWLAGRLEGNQYDTEPVDSPVGEG